MQPWGWQLTCLSSFLRTHAENQTSKSQIWKKNTLFAWVQEAKQRKISEFTWGRMRLQPWQRSFKQTKWKSCIQRKCLLLSGHFVFIVSSEIRTRAARERGKGNKKGRTLSRKRLISQRMKTHHYYHLRAVMNPACRAPPPSTYERRRGDEAPGSPSPRYRQMDAGSRLFSQDNLFYFFIVFDWKHSDTGP